MQGEVLLALERIHKRFGALLATDDVSLEVRMGEIHAIIGPNGAGKTTLAGQITGEMRPDTGRIWIGGVDVTGEAAAQRARRGLSRSYQIVSIFHPLTVLENIALAVQVRAGHSYRFWRPASGDAAVRDQSSHLLHQVGLDHRAGERADSLSHGEQRQLELAMTLAGKPRLLVLDEPLAGMGPAESAQVVGLLQTLRHDYGILLIEHDMDAVFALANRISVLVYGRVIASGSPGAIRTDPLVQSAYLGDEA